MSYQVLARKWRPQIFEDLVGQETVTRTLTHAIQQDRIAHAFLFSGVRGVGKTSAARILAKALNCASGPTVRPCGECSACEEITRGSSMDVLEIDGASNNGVEQIREVIEASRYAPSRDRFKIYIIDEVHMLTAAAFNALLKTLEEPPPSVKFVFATTEYHKIPETILSRCQEFEFRTVGNEQIALQLSKIAKAEGIDIDEAGLIQLARAANGSLRDGISAFDQVIAAIGDKVDEKDITELLGLIERDVLRETTRAIVQRDTAAILKVVDGLVRSGRDLRFFISALLQYMRDVLVCRVAPEAPDLLELPDEADELAEFAADLSEEDLLRCLDVLTQTESSLRSSAEPRFHVEMALLKLSQLRRLASFEELLKRVADIGGGAAPASSSSSSAAPRGGAASPRAPSGSKRASTTPSRQSHTPKPTPKPKRPVATDAAPPSPNAPNDWTADVPPVGELARPERVDGKAANGRPTSADELLQRLSESFRTTKPMLHALLTHRLDAKVEDDRLMLTFAPTQSVLVEQLAIQETRGQVEDSASELLGRRVRIVVSIDDSAPPKNGAGDVGEPPSASPADPAELEPESDALRKRARQDPLVRRFVETFQGEVEEIRPANDPT